MQLSLNIQIETRETILGAPIINTYLKEIRGQHFTVEVVGGRFAGSSYVYILWLDRPISRVQGYCGSTDDPSARFKQHERTWPLYRLTKQDIDTLTLNYQVSHDITRLQDRPFRRKHTFLNACQPFGNVHTLQFVLLNAAKKHTSNGIIMAANQRGIGWRVARLFQADRSLEFALKRRKQSLARFLPAVDVPF